LFHRWSSRRLLPKWAEAAEGQPLWLNTAVFNAHPLSWSLGQETRRSIVMVMLKGERGKEDELSSIERPRPCYEYQKMRLIKNGTTIRASQKPQHTPQKLRKWPNRDHDPLLHGFIWPLLGQKSSHKKCYRTEILATSARVIWPRAVALPDGFTIPWLPSCTADDFFHHEQTAGK
jgi:hypothetical protein